jgi:predicted neuraminidase
MRVFCLAVVVAFLNVVVWFAPPLQAAPLHEAELIFPPEHWHNHASCIVECPDGGLLVCWYNGSGERSADDVKVEGARRKAGAKEWSSRFLLADTAGFPDTNPCMFIDPRGRLWLVWQTLVANQWHTALCKVKIASSFAGDGPPIWESNDTILPKPGPEFAAAVRRYFDQQAAKPDTTPPEWGCVFVSLKRGR